MATAEPGAHVLAATTYSKSVLRVAAEILRKRFAIVHYFPSYEIITGAFNRGGYFAEDLRSVLETGVDHVMRLFMLHATGNAGRALRQAQEDDSLPRQQRLAEKLIEVECDEIALDRD
jgi:hypothetical protein